MATSHATPEHLRAGVEAILFLAGKPMTMQRIAQLLGVNTSVARQAIDAFRTEWNARNGGTIVAVVGERVQLVSHPDLHALAETMAKEELRSELTRPQLEALTIIAYRGPITKAELEQIRGVHCGLILRNLLVRGLVTERRDATRHEDVYEISLDFLRHLGLASVGELPEYERFHGSEIVEAFLKAQVSAAAMGETSSRARDEGT